MADYTATADTASDVVPRVIVSVALSDLRRAVALLRMSWERRNIIPVLGMVRVVAGKGEAHLTTTDLDTQIVVRIEAETAVAGGFMIDLKALESCAAAMTGRVSFQRVKARLPPSGDGIDEIRISDGETTIRQLDTVPVSDFPDDLSAERLRGSTTPTPRLDAAWEMPQATMLRMIRQCRHCISTEETRYYLNGIYFHRRPDGTTLRAVATDGHRLCAADSDTEIPEICYQNDQQNRAEISARGVIMRRRTVMALQAMLDEAANEPLKIEMGRLHMVAATQQVTLTARMIDGTYPSYDRVIPPLSRNVEVHMSRAGIDRLRRLASGFMGYPESSACTIDPQERHLAMRSEAVPEISIPLQVNATEGTPKIGYNINYLSDQARVTPSFTLYAAGAGDPAMVLSGDAPDAMWVIMPRRV